MNNALWISKTGMAAQDTKMSAISNNLANVNTVGFKKDRAVFEDLFYNIHRQPGGQVDDINSLPSGTQIGTGVRVVGTQKVFTQGNTQNTGRQLDLAVIGKGFFQIEGSDGEIKYSRDGQFQVNADGLIVTNQGLPLFPQISVPAEATGITVGVNGLVTADMPGTPEGEEIGQITLANFINPTGLEAIGGNLYQETASSGQPEERTAGEEGMGVIEQGVLEGSNVAVVDEMVDMISTQRAYEMNAKVVSAADGMLKYISQNM